MTSRAFLTIVCALAALAGSAGTIHTAMFYPPPEQPVPNWPPYEGNWPIPALSPH